MVASSDAGSTATRIDEIALLLEFLTNRLEIPAMKMITSATSLAAEAIGLADDTGSLEPGKKADIILVDGDPLTEGTTAGGHGDEGWSSSGGRRPSIILKQAEVADISPDAPSSSIPSQAYASNLLDGV